MELCVERESASPWLAEQWREVEWREGPSSRLKRVKAPADVGTWVCPSTILAWVVEEANESDWDTSEWGVTWRESVPRVTQLMVYVLAYAYARQIYDAEGIVRACRTDAVLEPICRGAAPFPAEVPRFRRQNRPLLEKVLAGVFIRAVRLRFQLEGVVLPAELEENLRKAAVDRLNIARHMTDLT